MNPNRELPLLDAARCISCGECVEICPTACLEMTAGLPWLPRPLDCIACLACELICPTEAIRVQRQTPA